MQVDEEKVYTVTDFIFLGPQITADNDYCHEIKRHLLLGKKAITNLDSVFKNDRHHSADKSPSSQSYGFTSSHVWMWELNHKEDWTLKNWCFQIIVLGKTLESKSFGQQGEPISVCSKEINPEYPIEGMMLKLKLQYFGHLMWRTDSLEKTLLLGRIESRKRSG